MNPHTPPTWEATRQEWRDVVKKSLKGQSFAQVMERETVEGIPIPALSSAQDWHNQGNPSGFPGVHPFIRGRHAGGHRHGWNIGHLANQHNVPSAAAAIKRALNGGAHAVLLQLDADACTGFGMTKPTLEQPFAGVPVQNVHTIEHLLAEHAPDTTVMLESGWAFFANAALLGSYWEKNDVPPNERRGCFGVDPFGACFKWGAPNTDVLDTSLVQMGDMVHWALEHCPKVSTVCIDLQPHHNAGCGEAQEIGFALACGLDYLRFLQQAAHLPAEQSVECFTFCFALNQQPLLNIAKLRAARMAWAQMLDLCNVIPEFQGMRQYAFSSWRMLTEKDPWVNLLRLTAAGFSAGLGGAETLFLHPFDAVLGNGSAFSQRMSRNLQVMLQAESSLHHVLDPAGGSWSLEKLTESFAKHGWEVFQAIEAQGGARKVLETGWWAKQIAGVRQKREARIEAATQRIVGINTFPVLEDVAPPQAEDEDTLPPAQSIPSPSKKPSTENENHDLPGMLAALAAGHQKTRKRLEIWPISKTVQAIQAALFGADLSQLHAAIFTATSVDLPADSDPHYPIPCLPPWREASAYEALRNACDQAALKQQRPLASLVLLGEANTTRQAQTHSINLLQSAGIEVRTLPFAQGQSGAKAFKKQGASIAVLLGEDPTQPYPQIIQALRGAGAKYVLLHQTSNPKNEGWLKTQQTNQHLDALIYQGCAPYPLLKHLLTTLQLLPR